MKQVLGAIRKAVVEYDMIQEGDRVAVGLSGGKDSMLLLYGLRLFQRFSPVQYELSGIFVNLGFKDLDSLLIRQFCEKIETPFYEVETDIAQIVFEIRNEKNPCALCSKMRNGALHNKVKEIGYHKIALGHHCDDVIETLFLNMLYAGKLGTFKPVTYLSNKDIYNIRPMIYVKEAQVIGAVKKHNIPVLVSPCPMDKNSKREEIKIMLKRLYQDMPEARDRVMTAIKNSQNYDLWK